MTYSIKTRNNGLLRSISILLIHSFLLLEAALAAPINPQGLMSVNSLSMEFKIPYEYVDVKSIHNGFNGRTIIHIQDPHSNYSGQINIAKAIDLIASNSNIRTVFVEGGAGNVSLNDLKAIGTQKEWKILANQLLMKSLITGAEYMSLVSEREVELIGVEEDGLYESNVRTYLNLIDREKGFKEYLHSIQSSLNQLKNQFYPRSLLDYESLNTNKDLLTKISSLENITRHTDLSYKIQKSSLSAMLKLIADESRLDFKKINDEYQQAIKILNDQSVAWVQVDMDSRQESIQTLFSQARVLDELLVALDSTGLNKKHFENLRSYRSYLREMNQVDMDALLKEFSHFENLMYGKILKNVTAKKIRAIDHYVGILKKAGQVKIINHEYSMLLYNHPMFKADEWIAYLNQQLQAYGISPINTQVDLNEYFNEIKSFYSTVYMRDNEFLINIDDYFDHHNENKAFFVAGGFHTENMLKLLKEKGYSVWVLTPRVDYETPVALYEEALRLSIDGVRDKGLITSSSHDEIKKTSPSMVGQGALRARYHLRRESVLRILASRLSSDVIDRVMGYQPSRRTVVKVIAGTAVSGLTPHDAKAAQVGRENSSAYGHEHGYSDVYPWPVEEILEKMTDVISQSMHKNNVAAAERRRNEAKRLGALGTKEWFMREKRMADRARARQDEAIELFESKLYELVFYLDKIAQTNDRRKKREAIDDFVSGWLAGSNLYDKSALLIMLESPLSNFADSGYSSEEKRLYYAYNDVWNAVLSHYKYEMEQWNGKKGYGLNGTLRLIANNFEPQTFVNIAMHMRSSRIDNFFDTYEYYRLHAEVINPEYVATLDKRDLYTLLVYIMDEFAILAERGYLMSDQGVGYDIRSQLDKAYSSISVHINSHMSSDEIWGWGRVVRGGYWDNFSDVIHSASENGLSGIEEIFELDNLVERTAVWADEVDREGLMPVEDLKKLSFLKLIREKVAKSNWVYIKAGMQINLSDDDIREFVETMDQDQRFADLAMEVLLSHMAYRSQVIRGDVRYSELSDEFTAFQLLSDYADNPERYGEVLSNAAKNVLIEYEEHLGRFLYDFINHPSFAEERWVSLLIAWNMFLLHLPLRRILEDRRFISGDFTFLEVAKSLFIDGDYRPLRGTQDATDDGDADEADASFSGSDDLNVDDDVNLSRGDGLEKGDKSTGELGGYEAEPNVIPLGRIPKADESAETTKKSPSSEKSGDNNEEDSEDDAYDGGYVPLRGSRDRYRSQYLPEKTQPPISSRQWSDPNSTNQTHDDDSSNHDPHDDFVNQVREGLNRVDRVNDGPSPRSDASFFGGGGTPLSEVIPRMPAGLSREEQERFRLTVINYLNNLPRSGGSGGALSAGDIHRIQSEIMSQFLSGRTYEALQQQLQSGGVRGGFLNRINEGIGGWLSHSRSRYNEVDSSERDGNCGGGSCLSLASQAHSSFRQKMTPHNSRRQLDGEMVWVDDEAVNRVHEFEDDEGRVYRAVIDYLPLENLHIINIFRVNELGVQSDQVFSVTYQSYGRFRLDRVNLDQIDWSEPSEHFLEFRISMLQYASGEALLAHQFLSMILNDSAAAYARHWGDSIEGEVGIAVDIHESNMVLQYPPPISPVQIPEPSIIDYNGQVWTSTKRRQVPGTRYVARQELKKIVSAGKWVGELNLEVIIDDYDELSQRRRGAQVISLSSSPIKSSKTHLRGYPNPLTRISSTSHENNYYEAGPTDSELSVDQIMEIFDAEPARESRPIGDKGATADVVFTSILTVDRLPIYFVEEFRDKDGDVIEDVPYAGLSHGRDGVFVYLPLLIEEVNAHLRSVRSLNGPPMSLQDYLLYQAYPVLAYENQERRDESAVIDVIESIVLHELQHQFAIPALVDKVNSERQAFQAPIVFGSNPIAQAVLLFYAKSSSDHHEKALRSIKVDATSEFIGQRHIRFAPMISQIAASFFLSDLWLERIIREYNDGPFALSGRSREKLASWRITNPLELFPELDIFYQVGLSVYAKGPTYGVMWQEPFEEPAVFASRLSALDAAEESRDILDQLLNVNDNGQKDHYFTIAIMESAHTATGLIEEQEKKLQRFLKKHARVHVKFEQVSSVTQAMIINNQLPEENHGEVHKLVLIGGADDRKAMKQHLELGGDSRKIGAVIMNRGSHAALVALSQIINGLLERDQIDHDDINHLDRQLFGDLSVLAKQEQHTVTSPRLIIFDYPARIPRPGFENAFFAIAAVETMA